MTTTSIPQTDASAPPDRPARTFLCSHCSSDNVVRDAWAEWSVHDQEWQLGEIFDHTFCLACETECTPVEKEVRPEPTYT